METVYVVLKDVTIVGILVIVSIHTIVEILDKIGYLPGWLGQKLHKRNEKTIVEILSKLGINQKARWIRSIDQVLDIPSPFPDNEVNPVLRDHLRRIVKDYIEEGAYVIGSTSQVPVQYFVNLRHAFCSSPEREFDKRLAGIMLTYIRDTFRREGISADAVAARRGGLTLLAYLVARAMGIQLLLYSEDAAVWNPRKGEQAKSRPRHMDYDLPPGTQAIIIDDSCVGGGSFRDLARDLKRHGIIVSHAFVLFCRKEVDARTALQQDGITFHSIDEYRDDDLRDLKTVFDR